MENLATIVNGFYSLTVVAKHSTLFFSYFIQSRIFNPQLTLRQLIQPDLGSRFIVRSQLSPSIQSSSSPCAALQVVTQSIHLFIHSFTYPFHPSTHQTVIPKWWAKYKHRNCAIIFRSVVFADPDGFQTLRAIAPKFQTSLYLGKDY